MQLITLDPGHFHAALVQKFMLPGVSPEVRVFAPAGDDVDQHLKRIESFNARADNPTHWDEIVVTRARLPRSARSSRSLSWSGAVRSSCTWSRRPA